MAQWSKAAFDVLQMPLRYVATFVDQHGLLRMDNKPQWRVIRRGATHYLEALSVSFGAPSNCRPGSTGGANKRVC